MPPKQKGVKMDLGSFLADDTFGAGGSWADEDVDFNTLEIPTKKGGFGATGLSSGGANPRDPAFGSDTFGAPRRTYDEYPIPDAPPYRARMNNLPWDITEEAIGEYLESCLGESGAVTRVVAPRDIADPSRLKGFAFITFNTREQLEKALTFSGEEMAGRRAYIAVAAPEKEGFGRRFDGPEIDWTAARGSRALPPREDRPERQPRREEPDIDWTAARGSRALPPREDRPERQPRREEPDIDWTVARGSRALPPREDRPERKPKREEPDIDWSAARGSRALPQREERPERKPKREEPDLDWGAARTGASLPAREFKPRAERSSRSNSGKKTEADVADVWARGSKLPSAATSKKSVSQKEEPAKPAIKKSVFAVLATEDDDNDEEELTEKTEKLSI